jgi:hypothetical protein
MRQTPRHLPPGGHLLRANQRCDVIEHHDDPFGRTGIAEEGRRDCREVHFLPVACQHDVVGGRLHFSWRGAGEDLADGLEIGAIEYSQRRLSDDLPVQAQ